jgi:hypothetical protein
MWKKVLAIIVLLYLFAVLQTSFFAHFSFFGAVPDLVFTLFFVLAFFSFSSQEGTAIYQIIFLSIGAGFFMDLFMHERLGPSILLLVIIGITLNGLQSSLKVREDAHPLVYFLPLFIISILAYDLFLGIILHFLASGKITAFIGIKTIFSVAYDSVFAILFFYAYRRINGQGRVKKQPKLFK